MQYVVGKYNKLPTEFTTLATLFLTANLFVCGRLPANTKGVPVDVGTSMALS